MPPPLIEVGDMPLSPERLVNLVKTPGSGCVVNYVGLIRDNSYGKAVLSVEYRDSGNAAAVLKDIAAAAMSQWPLENVAVAHRTGKLAVGDINFVVAIACAHREEGFEACRYIIDRFKEKLPTQKWETYLDGEVRESGTA